MLLKGYKTEISRPECNPGFQTVDCIAHLEQDISEVLPYLNAELGGYEYFKNPPAVSFRLQGKIIVFHGDKITINALKDEEEAEKILQWLMREVNDIWERKHEIVPLYKSAPKPNILQILKLLPGLSGCRRCGQPTCMVFATLLAQGAKGPDNCPELSNQKAEALRQYLDQFSF